MRKNDIYRLRDIEEKDLEEVLEWRNSERIQAVMFTDRFITMDEHRAWFARLKSDKKDICKIFDFNGYPAGVNNIVKIDEYNNRCSWGFYLGEVDLPRGTGTAMGYLVLEFIFEVMGIRKLVNEILAYNTQSINFHKRLGFVEEGRLVKHVLKNGKYEDVIVMSMFNKDWIKFKRMAGIKAWPNHMNFA